MVLTQSCACHTIAVFLGLLSGEGYHALRQRLREWCYDASDKRGLNRQAVDVTVCAAPLLAWVLRLWTGSRKRQDSERKRAVARVILWLPC